MNETIAPTGSAALAQPLFPPTSDELPTLLAERLHPTHLADLRASALSDETIYTHRFRTIYDAEQVARILNWRNVERAAGLGPCLEILFFDVAGKRTSFGRLKPLTPRTDERDGKVRAVKYEQPRKVSSRAYFPLGVGDALLGDDVVAITEGEKKALALTQEGLPTIGICGNWMWGRKKKCKGKAWKPSDEWQLNDDLAKVDWRREVMIVVDGDERRNADVLLAFTMLATLLAEFGAHPTLVPLQPLRG